MPRENTMAPTSLWRPCSLLMFSIIAELQLPGHHDGDDLLLRLAGDPLELLEGLLPHPAAPDDGAAPGAVAAGGVHDRVGITLVHRDQDQAIFRGLRLHIATLLFRQFGA